MLKFKKAAIAAHLSLLLIASSGVCDGAIAVSTQQQQRASPETKVVEPQKKQNIKVNVKQDAASGNGTSDASTAASAARYAYEFKQPDFNESRILIEHDGAGRGQLTFERKNSKEPTTEPLELSAAVLARLTALWNELRFLDSTTDYQADKKFPHLGTMRLTMQQDERQRTAEFNWTNDRTAETLVKEYRRISNQILFVFDMNIARQNQPLETPKVLKRLDSLLARNELSDLDSLAATLRDLNTDERLPLIARNHAERLLKKIEKQSRSEGK